MKLHYHLKVYEDAEDSWLLQKAMEKRIAAERPKTVLDVGTGTGIMAITAAKLGCEVASTDVDFRACELASQNAKLNNVSTKVICCDLASALKQKFDLIVFNPPYLPEIEVQTDIDRAVCGGPTGTEVFCRFVEQIKNLLNKASSVLFVYSSLEDFDKLSKKIRSEQFDFKIVSERIFDDGEKLLIGTLKLIKARQSAESVKYFHVVRRLHGCVI